MQKNTFIASRDSKGFRSCVPENGARDQILYVFLTMSHLPIPSPSPLNTFPILSPLQLYHPPCFWTHHANTCFKVAILRPGTHFPLIPTWLLPGSLRDCSVQKTPSKWGLYWFKLQPQPPLHTLNSPYPALPPFFSPWHLSPSYILYNWLTRIIIVSPLNHLRM